VGVKLRSYESLAWLDWLESERANIGMALTWGLNSPEAAKLMPQVIYELVWFWYRRGYFSEGRAWSERLLASPLAEGRTAERAFVLGSAASLALWQGDLHTALVRAEEELAIWQQFEDEPTVALALMRLGVVNLNKGDDAAAQPLLKEAQALFKELGNNFLYAVTLVHLGNVALGLGNLGEAREWLEKADAASRDSGDSWTISFVLNNFGEVARVQGDYVAARRYYEESESLLRAMGDKGDLARLICTLGYVCQHEGNLSKAKAQFIESLAMFRKLANKRGIAECLAGLAGLRAIMGSPQRAAQLLGAAEAMLAVSGGAWWPADRVEVERNRAAIKSKLAEATFAAEWAKGQAMTLEGAIASALDDGQ
jgi:tetratricopeptide (TPR) repeat protein